MSARVLNPAAMTEMSRNVSSGAVGARGGGRPTPSKAALARVRRDLFGPVDHEAAQALAERELRTQSRLDAERWGFDFHLELPRPNSRYEWEPVTARDVVPEPYALRGMSCFRKHSPRRELRLHDDDDDNDDGIAPPATTMLTTMMIAATTTMTTTTTTSSARVVERMTETSATPALTIDEAERTPPQVSRLPDIATTPGVGFLYDVDADQRKRCPIEPTTPVLPAARKQSAITDYMKSRKRGLNGTTKSMIEPPEKIARNAGQIRS